MEEVGELFRIISRKFGEQSFKSNEKNLVLSDEVADILWVLICISNQTGIDLMEAFKKNLNKKKLKVSNRHLNNQKLQ